MKHLKTIAILILFFNGASLLKAQVSPVISFWKFNTGQKVINGTDTIIADVQAVYYDSNDIYVKTSDVPDYYNFTNNNGNRNAASDLKATYTIPRYPKQNTGTLASTLGGGQYGLLKDGTLFFNGEDGNTYQSEGVWHQLAYYFESRDFDATWGHSTPHNEYHHHVLDLALQDTSKTSSHSPLIGFAFDGYPVYGPFGYSDSSDMTSKVIRMKPGYQKRTITDRTTLPDGTKLASNRYGPSIGGQFPLGAYREDYIFVGGSGNLDAHNGRFTKTPEYPAGTYAYFTTLDSMNHPVYPYILGQTLYGAPANGNMGPNGGKNTSIPGNAVKYNFLTAINEPAKGISLSFYPNPAADHVNLQLPEEDRAWKVEITDLYGHTAFAASASGQDNTLNISGLAAGMYILRLTNSNNIQWVSRLIKQ